MENLISDIDRAYKGLQNLQITATKANAAIVLDTLQVLEQVYKHLTEENHAESNNSGH